MECEEESDAEEVSPSREDADPEEVRPSRQTRTLRASSNLRVTIIKPHSSNEATDEKKIIGFVIAQISSRISSYLMD